ncbi:uncharacterized protein F5891DRAFT_1227771 [Suillus fuscotomentosus]|uniref:Uncharacterized protein n=1 Tax=Suillus fuscotomentosus TaxID=1912939 RepID=A0AAD4HLT3_9AGAM|nr:uncharacterized protein F5891DRAFT_1227771 [Suillus fuscotomentosus]KAG1900164.1 hypothetical protein F5891DRAFT_1227771 [Suillus fuscotomentosus]
MFSVNGNNQRWDGGGPFYWDGQGSNGGVTKPCPMMQILISDTLNDVYVVNSPAHVFFGILITQSYPSNLGTPGNGATITDINFNHSTTSLMADSSAYRVAVNCGSGSCTGDWDWSGLQTSGGKAGSITNNNLITGFIDTQ